MACITSMYKGNRICMCIQYIVQYKVYITHAKQLSFMLFVFELRVVCCVRHFVAQHSVLSVLFHSFSQTFHFFLLSVCIVVFRFIALLYVQRYMPSSFTRQKVYEPKVVLYYIFTCIEIECVILARIQFCCVCHTMNEIENFS